jgi:hypothetical protein
VKRTALEKNGGPDPGPVMGGKLLDLGNHPLLHRYDTHMRTFLSARRSSLLCMSSALVHEKLFLFCLKKPAQDAFSGCILGIGYTLSRQEVILRR